MVITHRNDVYNELELDEAVFQRRAEEKRDGIITECIIEGAGCFA